MFNRFVSLILVLALCLAMLTGCSSNSDNSSTETSTMYDASVSEISETTSTSSDTSIDVTDTGEISTDESVTESVADESTQSVDTSSQVNSNAPYDSSVKMDVTNVDFDALAELDNESISYGFNTSDRDDLNRPNGIYYYDNIYKDYGGFTHIDTDEKIIYLTMDEGYENGCTPEILDTLKEKGVTAVFFITKQFYDEQPELLQRMINEGHIIGNHTCSHPSGGMPQLGAEEEYEDIKTLNDLVYDTYGYQMKLFRYPEGVSSKQSIALLNMMGYKSVFWSFAYRDFVLDDQMDESEALSQCLEQIHPGAIYLLHAVSTTNTAILGDFIDGARAEGYEFGVFPVE